MADAAYVNKTGTVALDAEVFEAPFNSALVHECVRAEQAARRRGSASTKTRGQVRGGGAKPWRQKGTGRARAGSSRSPIWTGGGVTFGPQPRSYTFKVNRKERRAALRSALSIHSDRGTLAVLDPSGFDTPSTRQAAGLIAEWADGGSVLVVLTDDQARVALSFRNLDRVSVVSATAVGIVDIVGAVSLLATQEALDQLTKRAKGEKIAGASEEAD
jgi:large subunit ribosomal protein L4